MTSAPQLSGGRAPESSRHHWYEQTARQHHAGVYNYLSWLCRDRELAADLTQETFLKLWRNPPELRGGPAVKAWLFKVARNEFLQHRRRAGLDTIAFDETQESNFIGDDPLSLQARFDIKELTEIVCDAIGKLPDSYREVVVLHNQEGLTLQEVGEVLEIPLGTVKSRRAKAFELLRHMLAGKVRADGL
jgi:RNA polymerase sigma-70 factor, ECF subfamily